MSKTLVFSLILFLANIQWPETAALYGAPIHEVNKPYSCDLSAPTNLHLDLLGTTFAELAWDPVGGAAGYQIKVYIDPNNPTLFLVTTSINPFVTITGLDPGIAYRVTVAPMCNINPSKEVWSISENYASIDIIALILELEISQQPLSSTASVIYPDNDENCYFSTFEWSTGQFWIRVIEKGDQKRTSIHSMFYTGHFKLGLATLESSLPTLGFGRTNTIPPNYLPPPCDNSDGIEDAVISIEENSFVNILEVDVYLTDKNKFCITNLDKENYDFEVLSNITGFSPPGGGDRNTPAKASESSLSATNPFTTTLDVVSSSPGNEAVKIKLFHLNGQLAMSRDFEKGQGRYSLSTGDLAPGLYILRLETGNEIKTIKVVKTHN